MFLDFDGTLAPIVEDPAAATLLPGMRAVLDRLARVVRVAIVSGRGADDVRERVGVDHVAVAGSHGVELLDPDGARTDHPDAAASVASIHDATRALASAIGDVPGVRLEHKPFGVTVHDRVVAADLVDHVRTTTAAVAERYPDLAVVTGKRVTELRPAVAADKGRAVRHLLDRIDAPAVRALYIGDDLTDEDAFAALDPGDITVVVAPADAVDRPTRARFRVDDPGQVKALLDRLATFLDPTPHD